MGIQSIVKATLDKVMRTPLRKFYAGRNIEYLIRRYTIFFCTELDHYYMWDGESLADIHKEIEPLIRGGRKEGVASSKCPMMVGQNDFDQWIDCMSDAL